LTSICSRRSLLQLVSIIAPIGATARPIKRLGFGGEPAAVSGEPGLFAPMADIFPTQPPELAREMVTVAHYDLKRVQELVDARPSLARAAWDWGFGDWETSLGAASHMGNRPIAEYLISKGARPSLFSATMLGQLNVVKAFVAAEPHVQRISGPHSISLLAHAKAGGETARPVFEFLQSLGDADAEPPTPLSDKEVAALAGTYVFGLGMSQQIELTVDERQGASSLYSPLTWTRNGMMGRPLIHLGDLVFYPAGAQSVRIRFAEDKGNIVMTINDPELVLTARRRQESQ
jgi:hypothetical protein